MYNVLTVKIKKRPFLVGILNILSGVTGILAAVNYDFGLINAPGIGKGDIPPFVPGIILGIPEVSYIIALIAVGGGIIGLSGKHWKSAVAGAVAAVLSFMLFGVPALALVFAAGKDFEK